jgi:long-subunit acyl-CoA synthetase (AMP-forming)
MSTFTPIDNVALNYPDGSSINREQIEGDIKKICHYVQNVVLIKYAEKNFAAIVFPNARLFQKPDYEKTPEEGCFCPRSISDLGKCLSGCLHSLNLKLAQEHVKINSAIIINSELSVEDGTLSPAFRVVPENVITRYRPHLCNLYGEKTAVKDEIFIIRLGK